MPCVAQFQIGIRVRHIVTGGIELVARAGGRCSEDAVGHAHGQVSAETVLGSARPRSAPNTKQDRHVRRL